MPFTASGVACEHAAGVVLEAECARQTVVPASQHV